MRTVFTTEDIKNIVENIFNGNLKQYKLSNGEIQYNNPNSEKIILVNENSGEQEEKDIAEYLNISFYNWKQRLVEKGEESIDTNPQLSVFEDWLQSLNFSMDESYALVERIDEEVTASQDIDSATITGKITFLVQTNKISNLDYYLTKVRNSFLGNPQDIQNSYGDIIKAYILIGSLIYEQEPIMTQLGECVIVSSNFRISYLANAQTYNDTKVEISLDGDDYYTEDGQIVDQQGFSGSTKYLEMPITKYTWQNIFTSNAVPTVARPDLTGFISTSLSCAKTLSFYDYNKELTKKFNELFWTMSCIRKDGQLRSVGDVNIPVFIRITNGGHTYVFKDVIDNMEKVITNNDFNICSITLKGWGKDIEGERRPHIEVLLNPDEGTGDTLRYIVYQGEGFEFPPAPFVRSGYYLRGFNAKSTPTAGAVTIGIIYPVGFEMSYEKLQAQYKTYGDGKGKIEYFADWVAGEIPQCSVTIGEGIEILKTNKPITDNGNGNYTMELYTKLELSWDTERYKIKSEGFLDLTDGEGRLGSVTKRYAVVYEEVASLELEPITA